MISYGGITKKNMDKQNLNWVRSPNHSYKLLIIGDSRSGKTNALLDLIKQQDGEDCSIIDKIYLYVKNPNETKY